LKSRSIISAILSVFLNDMHSKSTKKYNIGGCEFDKNIHFSSVKIGKMRVGTKFVVI
jgi:hypothetical protein